MTAVVWIAIILAVVIVGLAIGVPYWLTHWHMKDHYEHSGSETYVAATGRTADDVAVGRPGRPWRRKPASRQRPVNASRPS